MRTKRWLSLLAGMLIGVMVSAPAPADWVNDWISQRTVSTPSFSSVRGQSMLSLGGFNARWQRGTGPTPILNFERPRFNVGCGGIDAKMGGFWFAGVDALVQKVQAIIQNAAAIMFKIALDTISQMLGGAAEWVEGVVKAINSIALDECQAARSLVDWSGAGKWMAAQRDSLMNTMGLARKAQDTGASPETSKAAEDMKNNNSAPVTQDAVRADCPTAVQQLLPINGQASLVQQALNSHDLGAWEDAVRGMVGDLVIQKNTNGGDTYITQKIASCYENQDIDFGPLIEGTMKKKPLTGACVNDTSGGGFRNYVETEMTAIANAMRNGTVLSSSQLAFLDELPPAIAFQLQTAAKSNTIAPTVARLTGITAKAYAYASLNDLYRVTRKAGEQYSEDLFRNKAKLEKCQIMAVADIEEKLQKWNDDIYARLVAIRQTYIAAVNDFNAGTSMTQAALNVKGAVDNQTKAKVKKGKEQ